MRALVIGRFQPFHRGHLQIIADIARRSEEVVVAIGSAAESHTSANPFTSGERHAMIRDALREAGVRNFSIVGVPDINRYAVWVAHVESMCPPFDAVVTRNPLTGQLFSLKGYRIIEPPAVNRSEFSATEVRRRMAAGGDWRALVPPAAARYIDDIGGVERVKASRQEEEE